MATPNYGYEKRQKELAKKKKKEDKLKLKADKKVGDGQDEGAPEDSEGSESAESSETSEPTSDAPPQA